MRSSGGARAPLMDFAWDAGAFRTEDAMAATGHTRSTVIAQCDALVADGWLETLEDARRAGHAYRGGRPARRFRLRANAAQVIGIDAGAHGLTAIATDLHARELAREQVSLDSAAPGATRRHAIDGLLDALRSRTGRSPTCLTIGVPAPVDDRGRSDAADNAFWARMNPDLAAHLGDLAERVLIENDANLAALAESAHGAARGARSSITLLSGERFGAGLIADGELVRGAHGAAGEMHVLDLVEGVGGSWGIAVLARRLAREHLDAGRVPTGSPLRCAAQRRDGRDGDPVPAEAVFAAARAGDPSARAILEEVSGRLARVAALLAGLMDVETIVIAGGIASAAEDLLPRARARMADLAFAPRPRLLASPLGADVVVQGAVTRALREVRERAGRERVRAPATTTQEDTHPATAVATVPQ